MSERERQERLTETLALLGRLTPAAAPVNRDEFFFRAGESSARGELSASPFRRRFAWPAVAATLALLAGGVGYAVASRQPEVQIVYVERLSKQPAPSPGVAIETPPTASRPQVDPPTRFAVRQMHRGIPLSSKIDIIHPQDWAALSDAFAQQLRSQFEQSETLASVNASAAEQDHPQKSNDAPRTQPRTYLELRDAMRAM